MRDMYQVMDMWGAWAAAESSGVDWPIIAAGFKGLLVDTSKSRTQCNDDDGILIDGCVALLKKYRTKEYEIVILHFVYGISQRAIARRRNCSDGTVRKDMQTALGFIDGCLSMLN
jgi:hypothetical protein